MMAGITPTQRTLAAFKKSGLPVDIVERYIHPPGMKFGFRKDLFGIIDIIVLEDDCILGIQSCGQQHSSHMKTITETRKKDTLAWLRSGGGLELWSWRKVKVKRGGKAVTWKPRVVEFLLYGPDQVQWRERPQ